MEESQARRNPHPLRLFFRFAALGVICFLLLAFILFQLSARMLERYILSEAKETRAKYISTLVVHIAAPEDFRSVKKGLDWKAFGEKISPLFSLAEVIRVKVYNSGGDLIWSDARELLEQPPPAKKNPELLEALAGHVEADISRLEKEEHRFERGAFRSLMELYVPIYFEQKNKPAGVVEVYLNIDPLFVTIRNTRWLIGLTIAGGMGLLFAVSFVGSGRIVALIHKQNQDLRRQEETQKLLKELSQDITSLAIDSLLKKLTEKVREVFKVDVCEIRVLKEDRWSLMGISGVDPNLVPFSVGVTAYGRLEWIIENRRPLMIPDSSQEGSLPPGETVKALGVRGYLGVPLFSRGGEVIGVLRALTYQAREFAQEEVDLIQQFANGAAIAIENGRLVENLQRSSEEQQILREFLSNLLLLDPDEILQKLTDEVASYFKADLVWVRLFDERGKLVTPAASGIQEVLDIVKVRTLPDAPRSRARWMLENRKPLAVQDMGENAFGAAKAAGLHGYLGAPMFSRYQKPLGILVAMTRFPRDFGEREITLIEQFAGGAAIAVENSRLLRELTAKSQELESANRRLNRLVQEQNALREIFTQINLLDVGHLLHQLTAQALKLLNVDHVQVRLFEGGSLRGLAAAGKWAERIREQRRLGMGRSTWVMENQRPLAIKDISQDRTYGPGHFLREVGVKGYLVLPLISRGQKSIGVLGVASLTEREFTQEEITLAQQFAAGASIAIENARLFEEVQKKSQELEEAYKTKSAFLNTMAHELRTPLNVLIATMQLFRDGFYGALSEKHITGFEPMERNARNLLDLISGILDLARLEAKRVPLQIEEFPLKEIIDELESSFMPLVREKGLDLRFRLDDPTLKLKTDKLKTRAIIQNLLGNAVKYTDSGEVEVRVSALPDGQASGSQGKSLSILVQDTGIGIKESDLPHIFQAFYLAEGVNRRKYPGSGLGLCIVKRLLEMLSGNIRVQSEWGKGSTFTVTLPLIHPSGLQGESLGA